jgi:hypothetical protein
MYQGSTTFNKLGAFGKRIITPGLFPTVENLSGTITVGATSVNATARYNAADATVSAWPAWTYGSELSIFSTGADPTVGMASPLLGNLDRSVLINAKYYRYGSGNAYGDITTEDIYFEGLLLSDAASTIYYLYKYATTGYFLAWVGASNTFRFTLTATGPASIALATGALSRSTWYFLQGAINRDENSTNGAVIYANMTPATLNPAAAAATATVASPLTAGISATSRIAYLGLWLQANLWSAGATGKAEMDALIAERAALVKWW